MLRGDTRPSWGDHGTGDTLRALSVIRFVAGPLNAMGPITLFDKSFLQSVSADESVWFDHFSLPVVCPIFYVETLADLAKEPGKRTAEDVVADIARKFPEWGGTPCYFHVEMCVHNLLGDEVVMDGRVPRPGARPVKRGVVYERAPEEEAFSRWSKGQFSDVERLAAAGWRKALSELDLKKVAGELDALGIEQKRCRTLQEARDFAREIVNGKDRPMSRFALAALLFHIPPHLHPQLVERWRREGEPTFDKFAPYAAFVLTIEVFFRAAMASGLIGTERASNRTDIAYLFYLPFCTLFVSSDKLHRQCAPLFMRSDQEFVWGMELKPALKAVNAHFLQLPEHERDKGITFFAHAPPPGNLLSDLWDRHLRSGSRADPQLERDALKDSELINRFKAFREQPTLEGAQAEEDLEMMALEHSVRHKRGSWWQLPKDYKEDQTAD
jgi:hypothetical protein